MIKSLFKEAKQHIYFSKDELYPKTHFICNSIGSVGNIAMIINHLYFQDGMCDEIYIDFNKKANSGWKSNENPYDKIFNQKLDDEYKPILCFGYALTDYDDETLTDIRNTINKFFIFRYDILKEAFESEYVDDKTLGVHIRMHDMNAWHGEQYGYIQYDDYVRHIDLIIGNNDINSIFIASDNHESLGKLIKRYGKLIKYAEGVFRRDEEEVIGTEAELREKSYLTLKGEYNFISPFIDMLLLSRCEYLLGRKYSNFFHVAIMLGKTKFENIFELS